jgi:hypothetical protein
VIYFSDQFRISPEVLEDYGAFDVSLINDLPLFIDPFLLFNSSKPEYQDLHGKIIEYLRFLRNKALSGELDAGLMEAWFTFREVKQTWLGYSLTGNGGTGLGTSFARALHRNLGAVFPDFGDENVTRGSHLEKLCLIADGVGRDNISDFSTNLIKDYLIDFTEELTAKHLNADQRRVVAVPKARFDQKTETWITRKAELPFINGDYVLLTPIDMLTKDDVWINRTDLVEEYSEVAASVSNEQLRAQLNNYFFRALQEIQKRDDEEREKRRSDKSPAGQRRSRRETKKEPSEKQEREAALSAIQHFPEFIDHFIRWKEDHGDEAEAQADERVRSSERLYIAQVRELVSALIESTGFYQISGSTIEEARQRVMFLKDVIENKGGHRLFYVDGEPIRRESDLHILFRLTWCNTVSDVNREVNNGRGPSDFEVSRGRFDKSIVEFKLAKNSALAKNLQYQAEVYKKASDAYHALKVIVFFTREEQVRVEAILEGLHLNKHPDIVLIDARVDNKPSGSRADA